MARPCQRSLSACLFFIKNAVWCRFLFLWSSPDVLESNSISDLRRFISDIINGITIGTLQHQRNKQTCYVTYYGHPLTHPTRNNKQNESKTHIEGNLNSRARPRESSATLPLICKKIYSLFATPGRGLFDAPHSPQLHYSRRGHRCLLCRAGVARSRGRRMSAVRSGAAGDQPTRSQKPKMKKEKMKEKRRWGGIYTHSPDLQSRTLYR